MKRDLDYMISVMQAARDGKVIQYLHNNKWYDPPSGEALNWTWSLTDYRVKPDEPRQPREFWLTEVGTVEHIRVREVLPDDAA